MPNPLHKLMQNKAVAGLPHHARRAHRVLRGLAKDLWKDGSEDPFKRFRKARQEPASPSVATSQALRHNPAAKLSGDPALWHALPGEISEKMWGEGFVTPGGKAVSDMLIKPLGFDRNMSVLDLSAGLGGRMRAATEESGAYITGLEPDPEIAARGMQMSIMAGKAKHDTITHYVPSDFAIGVTVTRNYDCVIARETFYRVEDKNKFFTAIAACTKPQAQISFTDYIVNPEDRDKPAITEWMAYEGNAKPLGLVEMAEAWAQVGFRLRVHDDQTDFYRREVLAGLQRFARFLGGGVRADEETRQAVLRRLTLWNHRLAAMEQGMKFFRFYGTK